MKRYFFVRGVLLLAGMTSALWGAAQTGTDPSPAPQAIVAPAAPAPVRPPFRDDIDAFKRRDSLQPPPQHAIVFAGSSSFTKWTDLQAYFPGYSVINRGFGGSSLPDLIRYADDIILPYHPRQVVIYCGDNDLAGSGNITGEAVFKRFRTLYKLIRSGDRAYPGSRSVSILFISIKPSPSRRQLMPKMEEANRLIARFLARKKNAKFVDVYHSMLNAQGEPIASLFLGDQLHMNADGYAIWQKAIQPFLIKD